MPDDVTVATVRRADQEREDPDWRRSGAPACLAAGAAWRAVGTAAVLRVPSAEVPIADNIGLDPTHPDGGRCAIVETIPYVFERWLLDPIRR